MGFLKCFWQDFDLNLGCGMEVGLDSLWEFPSVDGSQNSSSKAKQGEKQGYPGMKPSRKQNKPLVPKGRAVPALLSSGKGVGRPGIDPEQLLGCGRADGTIISGMGWVRVGFGILFPGNLSWESLQRGFGKFWYLVFTEGGILGGFGRLWDPFPCKPQPGEAVEGV